MSDKELSDAEYDDLMRERDPEEDEQEITPQAQADNPQRILGTNDRRYPTMTKLLAMQRELSETVLQGGTEPKDKASCARAWKELELLRRIILGKHITVEPAKSKAKGSASPMLTLQPVSDQSQAA